MTQAPPVRRDSSYIPSLTGLRYFAALGIVLTHSIRPFGFPEPPPFVHGALGAGVSFFFVLSGFVLTLSLDGRAPDSLGTFYWRRFARIVPLYWAAALLAVVLMLQRTSWENLELRFTALPGGLWTPLVLHFSMLQAWVPIVGYPTCFNGPAWSLSVEMFFYALFPLLLRLPTRWLATGGVGGCLLVVSLCVWWETAGPWIGGDRHFQLVQFFPPVRLLEFVAGIVVARFCLARPTLSPSLRPWLVLIALAAIALWCGFRLEISRGIAPHVPAALRTYVYHCGGFPFFALAMAGFFYAERPTGRAPLVGWFLASPPLQLLGNASYAIYLLHVPIRAAIPPDVVTQPGVFVAYLLGLHLVAIAAYLLLEIPARRGLVALGRWVTSSGRRPPL